MKERTRWILQIIAGVLISAALVLLGALIPMGLARLTSFLTQVTEHIFLAKALVILIVFFLVVVTAISKVNLGGDALGMALRELFKNKKKDQSKDSKKKGDRRVVK